jgi:hypothetical protein
VIPCWYVKLPVRLAFDPRIRLVSDEALAILFLAWPSLVLADGHLPCVPGASPAQTLAALTGRTEAAAEHALSDLATRGLLTLDPAGIHAPDATGLRYAAAEIGILPHDDPAAPRPSRWAALTPERRAAEVARRRVRRTAPGTDSVASVTDSDRHLTGSRSRVGHVSVTAGHVPVTVLPRSPSESPDPGQVRENAGEARRERAHVTDADRLPVTAGHVSVKCRSLETPPPREGGDEEPDPQRRGPPASPDPVPALPLLDETPVPPTKPRKSTRAKPPSEDEPLPAEGTLARRVHDAIVGDRGLGPITGHPCDLATRITRPDMHPGVDVLAEVLRAAEWLVRNPGKRDGRAYLLNWLRRSAADVAARPRPAPTTPHVAQASNGKKPRGWVDPTPESLAAIERQKAGWAADDARRKANQ